MIPKGGGKRDPYTPQSYHPISLLSNISKVFEKLVAKHVTWVAIQVGARSSTQFRAIENCSAINALFAITHPALGVLLIPTISNFGKLQPDRPTLLANDICVAFNNSDPA